jgi:hypothetical protein
MSPAGSVPEEIRYAGYDIKTGRIVHTHARFSIQENRYVEIPIDELKSIFSADAGIVAKLSDGDPVSLDYIKIDPARAAELSDPGTPAMVDTATRRLVARPRLVLSTTANQLAGDGQDSADIAIALVNEHGAPVEGAAGAVKVTTERGKLSARGGLVNLVDGQASITLTSTSETVSHVRVTAAPVDRVYASAFLDLEFV